MGITRISSLTTIFLLTFLIFAPDMYVISIHCRTNADCPRNMCKIGLPECDQTRKECWCFLPPSVDNNNIPNVIPQVTN
ncbi:Nodule Cysteine-Rich (NCR) secreted peptide [Medicago truncatula]|uniref:Nodule Cysteine-Rich (NCR) secreted peptide n=1 Tax=Medicago truncatula TaxID=3880 RepID=G7IZI9_MEDTR|nr:Nodule Cysteine-Rich (NCR) secreted peptide [Medicago truncatula]